MKKSTILMAIFAMMATATTMVSAAGIDFDGRTSGSLRSVNFSIANSEINQEIPAPVMVADKPQGHNIESMSGEELERLNKHLDSSIKTAIDYCNKNHLASLKNNFMELLANGTVKDKYGFVYNSANKYIFQNKAPMGVAIQEASSAGQQKGGIPVCMSWGTQNVCIKKETWTKVCTAGALVCVAGTSIASGGTVAPICTQGAAVCAFVAAWIDECNDVPYCTNWYTEVM